MALPCVLNRRMKHEAEWGERMKALKITPDGEMIVTEISGESIEQQNTSIHGVLGGHFDVLRLSDDAGMLVDDEGLLKALSVNVMAMMISGYPMLVGIALIVGLAPTPDGDVFTDCPERFVRFAKDIRTVGRSSL